jgi:thioredoxin 2
VRTVHAQRVCFAKVNTEAEQTLATRHGILSIPTLAIFKGGRELDRVSGALPAQQLEAWLRRFYTS